MYNRNITFFITNNGTPVNLDAKELADNHELPAITDTTLSLCFIFFAWNVYFDHIACSRRKGYLLCFDEGYSHFVPLYIFLNKIYFCSVSEESVVRLSLIFWRVSGLGFRGDKRSLRLSFSYSIFAYSSNAWSYASVRSLHVEIVINRW